MYNYEYNETPDGNMSLKIHTPTGTVMMVLSPEVEEHAQMITLFQNTAKLERYVEYLGSNPDRPFRINEITNL